MPFLRVGDLISEEPLDNNKEAVVIFIVISGVVQLSYNSWSHLLNCNVVVAILRKIIL